MSAADRLHEAVLDRMESADRQDALERFADAKDFFGWWYSEIEREIRDDIAAANYTPEKVA